jgi:hypothetical protein
MGRLDTRAFKAPDIIERVTRYRTGVKQFISDKEITPEEIIAANHKNIYWCELRNRTLQLSAGYSEANSRINDDRAIWRYKSSGFEWFFIPKYAVTHYLRNNHTNTSVGSIIAKWDKADLIDHKRCRLPTPVGAILRKRVLVYKRRFLGASNVSK